MYASTRILILKVILNWKNIENFVNFHLVWLHYSVISIKPLDFFFGRQNDTKQKLCNKLTKLCSVRLIIIIHDDHNAKRTKKIVGVLKLMVRTLNLVIGSFPMHMRSFWFCLKDRRIESKVTHSKRLQPAGFKPMTKDYYCQTTIILYSIN